MITLDTATDVVAFITPWLAAAFAVASAVAAERAFRLSTQAQPPERWRGQDMFHTGLDFKEEVNERSARNALAIRAAATQSIATYLAAAAAIEAAAASQHGFVAALAATFGIAFAGVLAVRRMRTARRNIAYDVAWFVQMNWSADRKWVYSGDPAVEDAKFAEDHPTEAAVLKRGRG
jgi:hypothetical protein